MAAAAATARSKGAVLAEYSWDDVVVVGVIFADGAGDEEDLDSEEDASEENLAAVLGPGVANAMYNRGGRVTGASSIIAGAMSVPDVTLRLAGTVIRLPLLVI